MKLRPFELALVVIFGFLFFGALLLLSTSNSGGQSDDASAQVIGNVSIWGTVPAVGVNEVLDGLAVSDKSFEKVSYRYIAEAEFNNELIKALADGEGPDLVFLSHERLVEMRKRISSISYESFPLPDIRNIYVDGANIFALSDGLYAYPIMADPLMMFWNRDIIATEGLFGAPQTWEEFVNQMFPKLIKRDFNRTIERGVVAMGEYDNIRNAFGIISALMIQGGSNLVTEDSRGRYSVQLNVSSGNNNPLMSAADFYTRFSKPSNALYSWNRSYSEDRSEFTSGNLVFYLGFGSESAVLSKLNPNLNFDVAELPQGATATVRRTYAKFYGLSVLNSSKNLAGASAVMSKFGSEEVSNKLAQASNMAPVRKTSLAAGSNDTYGRVIYQSAAIARGWLNPNIAETNNIFGTMTRDINENRNDLSGATSDAVERIGNTYND